MSIFGKILKRSGILKAQDGDVLVIRYGGRASARDAWRFVDDLIKGCRARPEAMPPLPKVPIVVAPKGVEWSLERKP